MGSLRRGTKRLDQRSISAEGASGAHPGRMSRTSLIGRMLCCGLLAVVLSGLHGSSPARADGPCGRVPCSGPIVQISYCWCPELGKFDPEQVAVDPAAPVVLVANGLREEAVLTDATGRVVLRIPGGAQAPLRLPGPGTYAYMLAAPPSPETPPLIVRVGGSPGLP